MTAYYNEFDKFAAQWLRNLIAAGHIAPGDVDERSITELSADDLRGYTQAHFFAGIGGWSLALRMAAWSDDRPVWTGSCPCQPFSAAGKRKGTDDARHLWPEFFRLIRECRPDVVFGEQVASAIGPGWLDGISADLEGEGYACGAAVLGAHSVGAPHIQQRLFWLADAGCGGDERGLRPAGAPGEAGAAEGKARQRERCGPDAGRCGSDGRLADADGREPRQAGTGRLQPGGQHGQQQEDGGAGGLEHADRERRDGQGLHLRPGRQDEAEADELDAALAGLEHALDDGRLERRAEPELPVPWSQGATRLVDALLARLEGHAGHGDGGREPGRLDAHEARSVAAAGDAGGAWSDFYVIPCADGKARRAGPGLFPLAHGAPQRVGRLRAYGNAIVPQVAAEFVMAWLECRP